MCANRNYTPILSRLASILPTQQRRKASLALTFTTAFALSALPTPSRADAFNFAPVYFTGDGYGWYYVDYSLFGHDTTNWISGGTRHGPGIAGDIANLNYHVGGPTLVELYYQFDGGPVSPENETVGILNLDSGPNGSYTIESYSTNLNYLIFDNAGATAQINLAATDSGNDIISAGVNIKTALDVTGPKLSITGPIIGGQLIVDCANLTLFGANSHTSTVLHSGTLNILGLPGLGAANGTLIFQGGTLNMTAPGIIPQALQVDSAGGTFIAAGGISTLTGNVIAANGTLHIQGGGVLELATSNAYTGPLSVENSTLRVTNAIALGGTSSNIALSNSTLQTTATFSTDFFAHITLSGGAYLNVAAATTFTISALIDGSGGLTTLTGTGTLELIGPNTFTGGISHTAGTLRVFADSSLGDPANAVAINSATFNAGATFSTSRSFQLSQATFNVDGNQTLSITSQIVGTGLTKTGPGTLALASANSFNAPVNINAGDILVSADNQLGNAANSLAFNGGGLSVTAGFTTPRPFLLNTTGGSIRVANLSDTLTATGQFTGNGSLTKLGPGVLVLTNPANSYDGGTNLFAGTLRIAADSMLGTTIRTLTMSDTTGSTTLNTTANIAMSRPINVTAGLPAFNVDPGTTLTLNGSIGGPAGINKTGSGSLVLAGNNSYPGGTVITDGSVFVSFDGNLGGAAGLIAFLPNPENIPATLFITASFSSARPIYLQNAPGSRINVASATTFTESGVISSSSGLIKDGAGSLILSNNNAYLGATTINAGVLSISTLASGGSSSGIGQSSNNPGNLILNGGTLLYSGPIATTDRLFTLGAGASTLDASGSGAVTFSNIGTIASTGSGPRTLTLTGSNSADNILTPSLTDGPGGSTSLVKSSGGTWLLAGANTYTGTTLVAFGTLKVTGSMAPSATTVNLGAALSFVNSGSAAGVTITNNPGAQVQFHNTSTAAFASITNKDHLGGTGIAYTRFFDTASAGNATITNLGGQQQVNIEGGFTEFYNSSSAGNANIASNGASANGSYGGGVNFFDTSSAGNATIIQAGAANGGNGAVVQFFNSSKAGTANFTNNPASVISSGNSGGGYIYFNGGTTADHATITNIGSFFSSGPQTAAGHTIFNGGASADHAIIVNNGAASSAGYGGESDFNAGASASNATITNNPGSASGAPGGTTIISGISGNPALAGNATFISNGSSVSGALGGSTFLTGLSSAGNSTFVANGGNGPGTLGGTTYIASRADGANSTLIANGGTNGGAGGLIRFSIDPSFSGTGGSARIVVNAGAIFDMSFNSSLSIGSIEGPGRFQLGHSTLTTGNLNSDTLVSGLIVDGGLSPGGSGSLNKVGTGALTLSASNTYSGGTTVAAGTLIVANPAALGSGNVSVTSGTLKLQPGLPTAFKPAHLSISGATSNWTGQVDLTSDKLIVQDATTHASSLATLQNQAAYGRAHPAGIISSTLPANYAIAVLDNAVLNKPTFGGLPVDSNAILLSQELLGDANADGIVNNADLATILNHFGAATPNWTSGNFDNAPTVNLTDLSFVLNNFGLTNPNPSAQSSALSPQSSVPTPEPASLALLLPATLLLKRKR